MLSGRNFFGRRSSWTPSPEFFIAKKLEYVFFVRKVVGLTAAENVEIERFALIGAVESNKERLEALLAVPGPA